MEKEVRGRRRRGVEEETGWRRERKSRRVESGDGGCERKRVRKGRKRKGEEE